MKKLVACAVVALSVAVSSSAFAEEKTSQKPNYEAKRAEQFAAHKQQMVANLNDEKSAIDQMLNCVSSAQNQEGMEKCGELRQAAMQKMEERRRANRREQLQNELKKIDEEEAKSKK